MLIFVNKKSELTEVLTRYANQGLKTYRTRTECDCPVANRRNAVLCVNPATRVLEVTAIKCKKCRIA